MSDEMIEFPVHGPGPRPLGPNLKTSVRVHGQRQVDEFEALCHLLGRRPHELAADAVLAMIQDYREDPEMVDAVQTCIEIRSGYAAERTNVIDIRRTRR